jgi:CheY-like chemotaxis protein
MPGSMDGLKLAAAIRGRWPPIKIVATSGLVRVGKDELPEGGRFLPKPYNAAQIASTLRELAGQM